MICNSRLFKWALRIGELDVKLPKRLRGQNKNKMRSMRVVKGKYHVKRQTKDMRVALVLFCFSFFLRPGIKRHADKLNKWYNVHLPRITIYDCYHQSKVKSMIIIMFIS